MVFPLTMKVVTTGVLLMTSVILTSFTLNYQRRSRHRGPLWVPNILLPWNPIKYINCQVALTLEPSPLQVLMRLHLFAGLDSIIVLFLDLLLDWRVQLPHIECTFKLMILMLIMMLLTVLLVDDHDLLDHGYEPLTRLWCFGGRRQSSCRFPPSCLVFRLFQMMLFSDCHHHHFGTLSTFLLFLFYTILQFTWCVQDQI